MADATRSRFTADQRVAIDARQPRVALSAGAGSGKTTVLVERFLSLVNEGVAPGGILTVTFTEKSAAEMKDRIVRRFEERGDDENRRRSEAAYISTIHGFCARLLRENPLAARVDPGFGILDGLARGIFLDEQLRELYEDEWFRQHVELFSEDRKSGYPTLFVLIRDAALLPRECGAAAAEEAGYDLEQHVEAAMRRVDEACAAEWGLARSGVLAFADVLRGMQVSGAASIRMHGELLHLLPALAASEEVDAELAERFCANTAFTGGAGKDPNIDLVRKLFKKVRPIFKKYSGFDRAAEEALERTLLAPLKVGIYARAERLRAAYEAMKRAAGLLDFEDLQVRARMLLEHPAVREEYSGRFSHILLDEAQDTNPLQMQILERLLDGRNALFAVGDVKQSIYGFRGAEVGLFQGMWERAGEGRLSLIENFRSRREVIDVVNAVGERLWEDGSIPFEALEARLPYPEVTSPARAELKLFVQEAGEDEESENTEAVRIREGAELARWIRRAVGADGDKPLQVTDRESGETRDARYGDIAILTATRTPVPLYEQALSAAGIPYVRDAGRGFFDGLEVADVLNALRVVLNPRDDLALLSVLRSPMFGWSDADLVRLRRASGRRPLWSALQQGFQPESPRSDPQAYGTLTRARAFRALVPPAVLIEQLLEWTHYRAALLFAPTGRAQVANLGKLVEFARATVELDGGSLPGFVERAAMARRHLVDEGDAPLASAEDDVVVLSTIHGAKGLEWPIVLLPALETDLSRTRGGSVYSAPDGVLLLGPKGEDGEALRPVSNAPVRDRIAAREEAEARRLFYVALTRAREYVILSGQCSYSPPKHGRFAKPVEWLAERLGLGAHGEGTRQMHLGAAELQVDFATVVEAAPPAETGAERALREARQRVVDGVRIFPAEETDTEVREAAERTVARVTEPARETPRTPAATTVTRLTYFYRCPLVYYFDLVLQVEEHPRDRARSAGKTGDSLSAAELGTRVHALLERADLRADPTAEAARLVAGEERLSESERGRMQRMLAAVLADPIMERVRRAARVEREYPFYLQIGSTTVEGVIDLLFADADGRGVVLDYKSNDLAAPDRLQILTEYYRPQIELYALAAGRAGLIEPREATLYFLNRPEARTHALDEARLDAVEAGAAEALARIGRGDWDTEPGEKCRGCGYRKRGYCEVGKRWQG